MLVTRAPLTFAILPAGLGLAAATWFVFGGLNPPTDVALLQARLTAVQPLLGSRIPSRLSVSGVIAQTHPLIDLGPATSTEDATLVLQGLSLGAGGKAALVAIGSGPPVWLAVGESRSGVTLRRVDASSAVVETVSGDHSLTLGSGTGHAGTSQAATATPPPPTPASGAAAKPTPPDVR